MSRQVLSLGLLLTGKPRSPYKSSSGSALLQNRPVCFSCILDGNSDNSVPRTCYARGQKQRLQQAIRLVIDPRHTSVVYTPRLSLTMLKMISPVSVFVYAPASTID